MIQENRQITPADKASSGFRPGLRVKTVYKLHIWSPDRLFFFLVYHTQFACDSGVSFFFFFKNFGRISTLESRVWTSNFPWWFYQSELVTPQHFNFWKKRKLFRLWEAKRFSPSPSKLRHLGNFFRIVSSLDCAAGLSREESKIRLCRKVVVWKKQTMASIH